MTTANSALQVTELDFDEIRAGLKTFLSSQTTFQDYDFDGSNMSILLDLLAYNTHYNAYYTNMAANEMFLKSAQLRNNVVERAAEFGYTSSSARGAVGEVTVTIVPTGSPDTITIPKNTEMTSVVDDETLTFTTVGAELITKSSANTYVATGVSIAEGFPLTHEFTVSTSNPVEYIIPNKNVDTTRISVSVRATDAATTSTTYTLADDITQLTGSSTVYFIEETADERYRIYFGDDILGNSLVDGNVVVIDYHVCNTTKGNGANTFTNLSAISGYSYVTLVTTTAASGGQEIETTASVKLNAPLHYERQNRVVTQSDYERLILAENSDFTSVNVWGGEDNDPPVYGRVYIAVNPASGTTVSDARQASIVTSLKKRNVMSIDPVIVDAIYLYVVPTIQINWNPDLTSDSTGTVESAVSTAITTYQTGTLDDFGNKFRFSTFSTAIDAAHDSIKGNNTTINMMMEITPTLNVATTYTVKFQNGIKQTANHVTHEGHTGVVTSSNFTYLSQTCFFEDDGNGVLLVYTQSGDVKTVLNSAAGTVDYTTGSVVISSFTPTAVANSGVLSLTASPASKDVVPTLEQIVQFKSSVITSVEDRTG
mgnify:CR=1 FL=1|jgi:hypothetical protein